MRLQNMIAWLNLVYVIRQLPLIVREMDLTCRLAMVSYVVVSYVPDISGRVGR